MAVPRDSQAHDAEKSNFGLTFSMFAKLYIAAGLALARSPYFIPFDFLRVSTSGYLFPNSPRKPPKPTDQVFFPLSPEQQPPLTMAEHLYIAETPDEVKNAKGLHLVTQSTPNGQKVQIMLEELAETYGTEWTTTLINISTNEQKKEWFLRLNPNGRIPVLVDNTQSPPFTVMETSAELLYLLKFADKDDKFGFTDELERSECLQWLFFWHGSGAPYQGQVGHFTRAAPEKIPCK